MIIKSLSGRTILETGHKTIRGALEYCAAEGIDMAGADLRRARLPLASLDGLKARGASFWGADFTGADMGFADLRDCDFRAADFKDTCLAQSDLSGADMRGAYFSGTLFEGAVLDRALTSCPSFWQTDLQSAQSFRGLVFSHRGERDIPMEQVPLIIRGLKENLILHRDSCIWGNGLYPAGLLPRETVSALLTLRAALDRMIGDVSRNAISPIPKIPS